MMKTVNPKDASIAEFHSYLLGAVAPRPIAFASTVDSEGNVNLSPFSFFNAFSANPPIMVFSPARRVRDNTTKHTLENVQKHPEVVINIVNYKIVEQMSLSSTEYDRGVNEFRKAGLTEVASDLVKPPRVGESPASFECKVNEVIPLGKEGGAGNLIVCEVLLAHFSDSVLNNEGKIDPDKLDVVGRMGGNWYTRSSGKSLFEIPKPTKNIGIGVDSIPESIRNSEVLTGNNLGRLGNIEAFPTAEEVAQFKTNAELSSILANHGENAEALQYHLHLMAQRLLEKGAVGDAWKVLMQSQPL